MDINPTYLKYFVDTVNEGSTLKASKKNFVSQPAISQGIKKLEDQLGLALLNHKRNAIEPTSSGNYVIKHAKQIFRSFEQFNNAIHNIKNEVAGSLKVAISISIAENFLVPTLKKYTKTYPDVELKIKLGRTNIQKNLLENNLADVGLTITDDKLQRFTKHNIFHGQFLLLGAKKHAPQLLITEERPETLKLINCLQKINSPLLNNVIQIESWNLILNFVESGLGIGLLPDFIVNKNNRLKCFNEELKIPPINYQVVIFYPKEQELSLPTKKFIEILKVETQNKFRPFS